MVRSFFEPKKSINCNGRLLDLSCPVVMGILNVTPDSFYDGGFYPTDNDMLKQTGRMISEGADIIDIGACSTRPGADNVSVKEELNRLDKALAVIRKHFPDTIISLDTYRAGVAKKIVENYQVDIINDISAGTMDNDMFETIAELQIPYSMMHIKGTPQNMQKNPVYDDILQEIFAYFSEKVEKLTQLGVNDIIIDPGFGFGKTLTHNYQLLKRLDTFKIFELPLLVGVSRKSMIYKLLETSPDKALNGTTAIHTIALQKGADILRVHDVKQAREAIRLVEFFRNV